MAQKLEDSGDKITTTLTSHNDQRTYAMWVNRDTGDGGGGNGRYFDKNTGSGSDELMFNSGSAGGLIFFDRTFSISGGEWNCPRPSTLAWHQITVTYDSSSISNNPLMYVDGTSQTVTETAAPDGTAVTNTDAYVIGNRGTGTDRVSDAQFAEFAIWNRILTASEVAALADGYSPLFMSNSLVLYCPLVRNIVDFKNAVPTAVGNAITVHPRIIYPTMEMIRRFTIAIVTKVIKDIIGLGVVPFPR